MNKDHDIEPWYRQFWPWFIIILPATVVVACIITIIIAINNPDSLVKDNYYKEGMAINRSLELDKRALTLQVSARYTFNNKQVQFSLTPELVPEKMVVQLIHTVDSNKDQQVTLTLQETGLWSAVLQSPLEPQRWYLELDAYNGGKKTWRLRGEANLANSSSGELAPAS